MNVPTYPHDQLVNKDGTVNPSWQQWFSQLTTEMQQSLSNNGTKIPQLSTTNINDLSDTKYNGFLFYDSETNELKANINGTIKVVQVV